MPGSGTGVVLNPKSWAASGSSCPNWDSTNEPVYVAPTTSPVMRNSSVPSARLPPSGRLSGSEKKGTTSSGKRHELIDGSTK